MDVHLNNRTLIRASTRDYDKVTHPLLQFHLICNNSLTDPVLANSEWLLLGLVGVPSDEVLEEELRVGEVTGVILERLSVTTGHSLLQIGCIPDPLLHLVSAEEVLTLGNELIGTKLHIFVEEVATEDLLAILVVQEVADNEEGTEGSLGHERHILVVEHDVVVVEEQEGGEGCEHHVLLVVWVIDVEIGHIVVPFGVVRVEEKCIKWELWSNTSADIKQVEHLFDRLVTLLAHTSVDMREELLDIVKGVESSYL